MGNAKLAMRICIYTSTNPRIMAIALNLKMGAILNRAGWTLKMNPPEAMENPLLPQ